MAYTKAGEAFTEMVLETFRLNGRLLAAGDRLTKPLGLTSSRWQVLGTIESRPLSVSQIARTIGLTRQNVQRIADILEQEGFIFYALNPEHQRAKLVCLTTKATRSMCQLGEIQMLWANRISSTATAVDIRTTLKTMSKLVAQLEAGESNQ